MHLMPKKNKIAGLSDFLKETVFFRTSHTSLTVKPNCMSLMLLILQVHCFLYYFKFQNAIAYTL